MFFINWNDQTSAEIYCQFRGLHEISHLKTRFNGKVLKLLNFVDPNSINRKLYELKKLFDQFFKISQILIFSNLT